jgi:succinate dehydrogenase / fumarate reductase, cytochrome b subunit
MKGFLKSSIGKKLLMSLSGLFLVIFLLVHLTVNIFLFFGQEAYNAACEFMENPAIRIIEPILAAGFLVHIIYSLILTIQNRMARGNDRYAKVDQSKSSTWVSRNMFILGIMIFCFLAVHLLDFFLPWRTSEIEPDPYITVTERFKIWYISLLYIIGFIALGLHLHHAFWSAIQTLGLNNEKWRKRWTVAGDIYAIVVSAGFALITLFFWLFN